MISNKLTKPPKFPVSTYWHLYIRIHVQWCPEHYQCGVQLLNQTVCTQLQPFFFFLVTATFYSQLHKNDLSTYFFHVTVCNSTAPLSLCNCLHRKTALFCTQKSAQTLSYKYFLSQRKPCFPTTLVSHSHCAGAGARWQNQWEPTENWPVISTRQGDNTSQVTPTKLKRTYPNSLCACWLSSKHWGFISVFKGSLFSMLLLLKDIDIDNGFFRAPH